MNDKLSWLSLVAALIQIVVLVMLVIEDQLVFSTAAACAIVYMVIKHIYMVIKHIEERFDLKHLKNNI